MNCAVTVMPLTRNQNVRGGEMHHALYVEYNKTNQIHNEEMNVSLSINVGVVEERLF